MVEHMMRGCVLQNRQTSRGFTLVELLVVISIIAMLAAILLPAINAAMRHADKAKARMEIKNIESAWKAYFAEYARWPKGLVSGMDTLPNNQIEDSNTGIPMDANVVRLLRGENINNMNPKKITFLEITDAPLMYNGQFVDPWENPYKYMLDYNYNNQVLVNFNSGSTNLYRNVAVWSRGPDGADHDAPSRKDNPTSWE